MAEKIISFKIVVRGTEEQVKIIASLKEELRKLSSVRSETIKQEKLAKKETIEITKEIKKLKGVFKSGAISQKEFNGTVKKYQLLQQSANNTVKNTAPILAKVSGQQFQLNSTLKKANAELKRNTTLNKAVKGSIGQINAQLAIEKKRINDVVVGSKKFKIIANRIKDLERKQRDFNKQLGRGSAFANQFGKGAANAFTKAGLAIGGVLIALRTLQRLTGGIIKITKDFEQANADLAAILGKSRKEITELTTDAKRLGATTAFTATEVSKLQKEFAKLGFSTKEILNATEATLSLAAATGTDLAEAAKVVGATIRGFGLDASETQRVVDVMAKSFSSSALDMEKFEVSMSKIAPVAKAVGLTIEETTGFMGVLSDSGIEASTVGTSLRKIFIELSKKGLTLNEALGQIEGSQDKLNTAQEIFGIRAATSALVLAENADKAALLTAKLNLAAGTADRMAKEQLNTLQGKLTILNSAWEGFILSIDAGDGVMTNTLSTLIELATGVLNLASGTGTATEQFNEQAKTVNNLENNIVPLIDRYDELTTKTELSKDEQTELDAIIQLLAENIPSTVTEFDKYGKALGISTEAARAFVVEQKAILGIKNKEAIEEQTEALQKLEKENKILLNTLNGLEGGFLNITKTAEGFFRRVEKGGKASRIELVKLTEEELLRFTARLQQTSEEIKGRQAIIAQLKGEKTEAEKLLETTKQTTIETVGLTKDELEKLRKLREKDAKERKKTREQFTEERRLALLSERERERDALKKRVEELKKAGADEEKIKEFNEEKLAEITKKFRKKDADAELKAIQDRVKAEQDGVTLRLLILTQEFNEGKITEEKFKSEKLRIRRETLEGIKGILEAEVNEMTASLEDANVEEQLLSEEQKEALLLRIDEVKLKIAELEKPTEDEEKLSPLSKLLGLDDEQIEVIFEGINAVKGVLAEIGNLQNTITNEKIKANNEETASLTKSIDAQIKKANEQGQNTKSLEDEKQAIIEANEERNKVIGKEGFERNKKLQIGIALISGAQAILAVLAAPPATDLISDGIIRAIRIAATAVTTGIQIAAISKQTFQEGGILEGSGHEQGGIPFAVNGQSGFEAEGGELLVNKNIHSRPDFVNAISQMNFMTGGKRFQGGAILPTPNIRRAQEAAIFRDTLTREEAVELVQEGIATITVQQVESEVTETQKIVETIQSGSEF